MADSSERRADMFPRLTATQIARLLPVGRRRRFAAGEVIYERGSAKRAFYVLLEGRVEIAGSSRAGEERLTIHEPGSSPATWTCSPGGAAWSARARGRDAGARDRPARPAALVQTDAELSEIFLRAFILRRAYLIANTRGRRGAGRIAPLARNAARSGVPDAQQPSLTPTSTSSATRACRHCSTRFPLGVDDVPVLICRGRDWRCATRRCGGGGVPRLDERASTTHVHDLVVVGAGPPGLAAAVYAASEGLDVLVLESERARRPGRLELAHRELPRLPDGHLRPAPRRPRVRAGREVRRGVRGGAHGGAARLRPPAAPRRRRRRRHGAGARGHRRHGRAVPQARPAGAPAIRGHRRLLRGDAGGGERLPRRGGHRGGRRQLRGPGGRVPVRARAGTCTCSCAGRASPRACRATSSAASRRRRTSRCTRARRSRRSRATGTWSAWPGATADAASATTRTIRHVFLMTGAAPNTAWLSGCVVLDEKGFVKTGPDLTPEELAAALAAEAPALSVRDEPAARVRGRRRAGGQREARGVRGGRGLVCVQLVHKVLAE